MATPGELPVAAYGENLMAVGIYECPLRPVLSRSGLTWRVAHWREADVFAAR